MTLTHLPDRPLHCSLVWCASFPFCCLCCCRHSTVIAAVHGTISVTLLKVGRKRPPKRSFVSELMLSHQERQCRMLGVVGGLPASSQVNQSSVAGKGVCTNHKTLHSRECSSSQCYNAVLSLATMEVLFPRLRQKWL